MTVDCGKIHWFTVSRHQSDESQDVQNAWKNSTTANNCTKCPHKGFVSLQFITKITTLALQQRPLRNDDLKTEQVIGKKI